MMPIKKNNFENQQRKPSQESGKPSMLGYKWLGKIIKSWKETFKKILTVRKKKHKKPY